MKLASTVLQAKRYGVYHCSPETPLLQAARRMVAEDISALVVADAAGYLAGIFSRTDLLRAYQGVAAWETAPVGEHMSRAVVTVGEADPLEAVVALLTHQHIHRVVVVRDEPGGRRPLAVISDADVLYHLVKAAEV